MPLFPAHSNGEREREIWGGGEKSTAHQFCWKAVFNKGTYFKIITMHWAYLYTQIYLLARVRKVLEQLFIHWTIRSYRKQGFCTVTYTQHLRLSTSIDLYTVFNRCLCVCVQMSTVCCTKVHIQNSSKMQLASTNQPFVSYKNRALDQTKDDHCLFK